MRCRAVMAVVSGISISSLASFTREPEQRGEKNRAVNLETGADKIGILLEQSDFFGVQNNF